VALVVAVVLVALATAYVSGGHGKGDLAPTRDYSAGRTDALAAEIAERGPFLVADASPSRRRDIYIQHLGRAESEGWVVVSAFAPDQTDRECFLRWSTDDEVFRDPCTGTQFPKDGTGLTRYPTRVDDHRLYVDLNG